MKIYSYVKLIDIKGQEKPVYFGPFLCHGVYSAYTKWLSHLSILGTSFGVEELHLTHRLEKQHVEEGAMLQSAAEALGFYKVANEASVINMSKKLIGAHMRGCCMEAPQEYQDAAVNLEIKEKLH